MARAESPPQLFLASPGPRRTLAVIGFLQLCGLTDDRDPDWRHQRPTA